MDKWEMKWIAETNATAIKTALSEGWEPFSVVLLSNGAIRVYVRRKAPAPVKVGMA